MSVDLRDESVHRSVDRPVRRLATPTRLTDSLDRSHGRTDGRTHERSTHVDLNTYDSERAHEAGNLIVEPNAGADAPSSISDVLMDLVQWFGTFNPQPARWPVIRTGEREPIPWPTRLAVAKRDSFICRHCHTPSYPAIEIDHIVPWSAGGGDESTNLRVLCVDCNQKRSNRHDATESWTPLPVTWWCSLCWHDGSWPRKLWRTGDDLNVAHRVANEFVTAFCAYCEAPRQTDLIL